MMITFDDKNDDQKYVFVEVEHNAAVGRRFISNRLRRTATHMWHFKSTSELI